MKKIPVSDLKPGMAYDKPVYLDPDNMLVNANEAISVSDIERLEKWNISEVETAGEPVEVKKPAPADPETAFAGTGQENPEEKADLRIVSSKLKKTSRKAQAFKTLMKEGEVLLKEGYESIAEEKPYQISRIRTLAEQVSQLLDDAPECYFFIYYQTEKVTVYNHVMCAAFFAGVLGNALDISKPRVIELIFSIMLMKIGMLLVPKEIREKEGQLTSEEKQQLRTHPILGYQLLTQQAKVKNSIAVVALQHHEHFDGSGYPRQIKGAEMSDFTKIAAIADSFAALLENKSYRSSKLPYEAMKELVTLGVYRYDPVFLKGFLDRLSIYPIGSIVQVSDNTIGVVAGSVPAKPMRPILLLLRDEASEKINRPTFLHLLHHNNKYLSQAIEPGKAGVDLESELLALEEQL